MENKIREYLRKPYSRILIPDSECGGFAAQMLEFPGCFSEGKTAQKAYQNLEEAAYSWLESAIKQGMEIPEPFSEEGYSGKVALRMSKSLHARAVAMAKREGISLNLFIVSAVACGVGAKNLYEKLADRLEMKIATKYDLGESAGRISIFFDTDSPGVANLARCTGSWEKIWRSLHQKRRTAVSPPKGVLIPELPSALVQ